VLTEELWYDLDPLDERLAVQASGHSEHETVGG
jgi:hypothetical protein